VRPRGRQSWFSGRLRPFQEKAVDVAWERGRTLIAYEMGLGKTVVSIAAIEDMWETRFVNAGLIICPASLKFQWAQKICEFTGGEYDPQHGWRGGRLSDDIVVIDGTPAERKAQYADVIANPPLYTILNFDKVRDEWPMVTRLRRDYIVTDEITALKNSGALISKLMKRLQPRTDTYIGLTGQPVENAPEDLFHIMEVVDPSVLPRADLFDLAYVARDYYGKVERVKNLPMLWRRMGDSIVRKSRHDPDVAPYMPQVDEVLVPIKMDRKTAKVYNTIVQELLADLDIASRMGTKFDVFAHYSGGSDDGNMLRANIMSKLTVLRMLCDHPDLVRLSGTLYDDPDVKMGSAYASDLLDRGLLDKVTATPKMTGFLNKVLDDLATSKKAKIVVFSTFKPTLSWLQKALADKRIQSVLFTGDMTAKQKDAAKQKFASNPFCRVFLSSDAGGYGVDLPNANFLKNYDLPFSGGKFEQRNARIIRLSSEFDKVHLEHYVIEGSFEERQYEGLRQRNALASAMIDRKGVDKKGGISLGLESLREFLQHNSV
jgi:SNF2 family DNA or RNA helicase